MFYIIIANNIAKISIIINNIISAIILSFASYFILMVLNDPKPDIIKSYTDV